MIENFGEMIIYRRPDGLGDIEAKIKDESVWLSQQQMSELFQTSRTNIVEHIKHIYEEEELEECSTCRKFRQVRKEGARNVDRYKKRSEYPTQDYTIDEWYKTASLYSYTSICTYMCQWGICVI